MFENPGRAIALIATLLLVSIVLIVLPEPSLRMGLDLAGGQRLVYELDFDEAEELGLIERGADRAQLLEEQIEIMRERIDPSGITEPVIRSAGENRIEINIPGSSLVGLSTGSGVLGAPLGGADTPDADLQAPIVLDTSDEEQLAQFPGSGGVVSIGAEKIKYARREGSTLVVAQRGYESTPIGAHPAGTPVDLESTDQIKERIENLGDLRFLIQAQEADFTSRGTDLASEQTKLTDWWARPENAAAPITAFNALPPEQGGPVAGIQWYPMRLSEGATFVEAKERARIPVIVPDDPEELFSGQDLRTVRQGVDDVGFPAVHVDMESTRATAMRKWTRKYLKRPMAMVLNNEVLSAPTINSELGARFIIEGRFTQEEVNEMVTVLRSGSLKIRPKLLSEERVGPSLGAESVRRGVTAGLVGLVLVIGTMMSYYRGLGVAAAISLLCNLMLLLAVMTFLQATLTLPGIAGIILTIGMAVDANILIFDRIREESEKGRKPQQAALNGFKQAFSAIFDSNVTTLITAFILYKVGSGPVRGFAVTLGWGIMTSLFSALVIARMLVHFMLARGVKGFPMRRWLADANYNIIGHAKPALIASTLFIGLGLATFAFLPEHKKYGLDFLGGAAVKVRTEEPRTADEIRAILAASEGPARSSEVTALPTSEVGDGRYTEFRVTVSDVSSEESEGNETELEFDVRAALAGVIQQGPLTVVSTTTEGSSQTATVDIYFEERHEPADVASVLAAAGYADPQVTPRDPGRNDIFRVVAKTAFGIDDADVAAGMLRAFRDQRDAAGAAFTPAQPVPEVTVVGRQVVGDLKDSAILGLIISLFATVMYLRVRFAEYSYGIAAMVAVLHDVLAVLAFLAFAMALGWSGLEINLTMIAVFLTIVGYSLNDTIIIFDRVRENLPRMKGSLTEVVNTSTNQTLSRTIITSMTTLMTVVVLLAFNVGTGSALESFAIALTVGILVGSYSTLFLATPLFIWLEERAKRKTSEAERAPAKKPSLGPSS